jgi:hypothetical protein
VYVGNKGTTCLLVWEENSHGCSREYSGPYYVPLDFLVCVCVRERERENRCRV